MSQEVPRSKTALCVAIAAALSASLAMSAAQAQDTAQAVEEEAQMVDEMVVTGTRGRPRSVAKSAVPVDVISGDDFVNQGGTDLSDLIRNVVPSYNVNAQPISDAATIVRPANLRGLAPDHTLVMINNKRRHRAAVIYWLGNGVADGAQGADISAIPSIALRQVEVLRDGASAQYGSDAIAGVMNFLLKDDDHGGTLEARAGSYYEGDGDLYSLAGNFGMPLTSSGFLNVSFEYGSSDATSRSVQRDDAAGLILAGNTAVANPAQIWGSPEIKNDFKFWANFGIDISDSTQFYGHGNYVQKEVEGGFYFRNPNNRGAVYSGDGGESLLIGDLTPGDGVGCPSVSITNNVPDPSSLAQVFADPNCFSFQELFPGGFTPRFGGELEDYSLVAGFRGETAGGIRWDVSAGLGYNEVDFFINNTVNASLGPDTPVNFDPGAYIQEEYNFNLDLSYPLTDAINIAGGAEYREENFEIIVGQTESFAIGPLASQGFSAASNGFPGFSPIAGGRFSRANVAVYGDVEWNPTPDWLIATALRWEDFDDFGTTTNGKIATNYRVNDRLAFRGSVSTGFRAPTPGQSNAFNVSTEFDFVINDLVNNGTIPSTNPVALLRGGKPLGPEESTNFTLGAVFDVGPVSFTVDYFNIELEDRITVSQLFSLNPDEVDTLVASGVTSAANLQNFRFFTNDFDTETDGIDVVATWSGDMFGGFTEYNLAFNHTNTDVTKSNPDTLDATRIRELQEGLPENRMSLTANHFTGNWRFLGRMSYYDSWFDSEDGNSYGGEILFDAEAAYSFNTNVTLTIGAQNIFDTFPEENPGAAAGVGNRYSQFSPFGFNGGFYYARVSWAID